MTYTISCGKEKFELEGARPYDPNRERDDIKNPKHLQSSHLAILNCEGSVEVWEIQNLDVVPQLLQFLVEHFGPVSSFSVAELLPAFRPVSSL